jgi:drug/metabolite transporter (DMT)-like permease
MALLNERMARHGWLGILIASVGALFVLGVAPRELGADSSKALLGGLVFMVTMLTWSGFNVLTKIIVTNGTSPLAATAGSMLFQCVGLLMLVPIEHGIGVEMSWGAWPIFGIVYMGILGTIVAFLAISWALQRLEGGKAGAVYYVEQVVGVAAAWLIVGEEPGPSFLLGGLLVLSGVYLVTRTQFLRREVSEEINTHALIPEIGAGEEAVAD